MTLEEWSFLIVIVGLLFSFWALFLINRQQARIMRELNKENNDLLMTNRQILNAYRDLLSLATTDRKDNNYVGS